MIIFKSYSNIRLFRLLQAKKQTFLDFSRRTDALAVKLGFRLGDLPAKLGISRASLFSYRTGKSPISNKAWQKLQIAERESGIAPQLQEQVASAPVEQKKELLASASLEEVLHLFPADMRMQIARIGVDAQIDSIQKELIGFFLDAESLADLVKRKGSKSDLKFFARRVSEAVKSSRKMVDMLVLQLRTVLSLDTRSLAERLADSPKLRGSEGAETSQPRDQKRRSKRKS